MASKGPLHDIVGLLARASVRSAETQRLLVPRLLAERDRLETVERGLAGCLHAAAVLAKVAPALEEEEQVTDVQRILRELVRFLDEAIAGTCAAPSAVEPRSLNDARLGELLVELGFVQPADVKEALARMDDGRLGDVLVEMGRVSRRDVEAAANLHRTMMASRNGEAPPAA